MSGAEDQQIDVDEAVDNVLNSDNSIEIVRCYRAYVSRCSLATSLAAFGSLSVQISDPNDPTCATFIITDEDHTLGNILRHFLMRK